MPKDKIIYADDDKESVELLLRLRIPSLVFGLLLGMFLSFVTSSFEEVIAKNIAVAYFIPFIVYLADAVGTQTQSIYIRDLKSKGKSNFKTYLWKESILGLCLGAAFGALSAIMVLFWFKTSLLATAVGFSVFAAIASSPLIALFVTKLLQMERTDPAVGAGPIATVIQDSVSVLIYGLIASAILL